jgi:hypothetical protein
MNGVDITQYPEHLRPMPLHRESLLNPNARTLWLARWIKGYALGTTVVHTIPQLPYRADIPTPAARFKDETVVKPFSSWVDTEDTILIGEKKIPYVRYPYDGEPDAPFVCYGGEDGWADTEYQFLDRAGVPIMLRFFVNSVPTKIEASLTDASNKRIAYRLYTNKDKRVPDMDDWATVLLLPNEKLAPRTRYTVTVNCTIKKTEFAKEWSFTTRSE